MNVFRIHIRPKGGANDPWVSFKYCLTHSVLGMGWGVSPQGTPRLSWDEYIEAAEHPNLYKRVPNVRFLKNRVRENDLVWTRDPDGIYYLGRVTSRWQYLADEKSVRADVVNFVRCELHQVGLDDVPGKVVACFRPQRTIQTIADDTVALYSRLLWNRCSNDPHYSVDARNVADIFSLLGDQATEDAVAVYLQLQGWLLLPESRKADTMSYEYILIHRQSMERAVVQVKTGQTPLDRDEWSNFVARLPVSENRAKAFLFQSYGKYTGLEHPNVECINPDDLLEFLVRNRDLLPKSTTRWVDFVHTQANA